MAGVTGETGLLDRKRVTCGQTRTSKFWEEELATVPNTAWAQVGLRAQKVPDNWQLQSSCPDKVDMRGQRVMGDEEAQGMSLQVFQEISQL